EVIALNNLVNDLGLDASSTGTYLAWAIELFEKASIRAWVPCGSARTSSKTTSTRRFAGSAKNRHVLRLA
ncbi:MAG: hypothetical protein H5U00_09600, partial [Clostridia bacterium]|nr:hypothetical protein [Clostridia bacterium]